MTRLFIIVFVATAIWACGSPAPTNPKASLLSPANDSLYTLVVKIHDEVMPENATIASLQQQLKKQMPNLSPAQKDSLLPILTDLQIAYDGMMDWMHQFKNTELNEDEYKKMDEAATAAYLQQEQTKIQTVAKNMRQSIANAKAWQTNHQ